MAVFLAVCSVPSMHLVSSCVAHAALLLEVHCPSFDVYQEIVEVLQRGRVPGEDLDTNASLNLRLG